MSKFDVEIDARVSALEAAVKALQSHSHDSDGGSEKTRVDEIERVLRDSGIV